MELREAIRTGWRRPNLWSAPLAVAGILIASGSEVLRHPVGPIAGPSLYWIGIASALLALSVSLYALHQSSGGSGGTQPREFRPYYVAIALMALGTAGMVNSMIGIFVLHEGLANSALDVVVQVSGLFTYFAWPLALLVLPARRMVQEQRLPWLMDVTTIVAALSSAGWFFLIAPQVRLDGIPFAVWLTLAYPLANVLSIASVVAAISMGGPFRSARGIMMAAISLNVLGDVLQAMGLVRPEPSPASFIHWLWIACVLLAGLAALRARRDEQLPGLIRFERTGLTPTNAIVPMAFLLGLIVLAMYGNTSRPNTPDSLGLNLGCTLATLCTLIRIFRVIRENAGLAESLANVNQDLDRQVRLRTAELSQARDDLEIQRSFLRGVIDSLPSVVLAHDPAGTVTLANSTAARFYGRTPEQLVGLPYQLLLPLKPEGESEGVEDLKRAGCPEMTVLGPGGEPRTLEIIRSAVAGPNGEAENVLVVGNDVTMYKEAERTLVTARNAAERANTVKSAFLANMSHELRTPLNGVIGFLDLLLLELVEEAQVDLAQSARAAATGLLSVISEVLDVTTLDRESVPVAAVSLSPVAICADIAASLRPHAEAKALMVHVNSELEANVEFIGDAEKIRQILAHLGSNAVKFTNAGAIDINVRQTRVAQDMRTLQFIVSDTGIGIPAERLEDVFEPFAQVDDSMTRRFGGVGLGLSICRQLAKVMGGSVYAQSEPGVGSRFTLELTLRSPRVSSPVVSVPGADGLRVLVVEDNLVNQKVLKRVLERMRHEVRLANNGKEALVSLAEDRFDVVLMDCQMPVMDGLEATRCIRQLSPPLRSIPIIAVTANALDGDRERCLAAGMDDYVPKPITAEALQRAIGQVTESRAAA